MQRANEDKHQPNTNHSNQRLVIIQERVPHGSKMQFQQTPHLHITQLNKYALMLSIKWRALSNPTQLYLLESHKNLWFKPSNQSSEINAWLN